MEWRHRFIDELGNLIVIQVTRDDRGITVTARGPGTEVEHTWTPREAKILRELLHMEERDLWQRPPDSS